MKFALVEWIHSNSTSIISTHWIRNKAMLSDPTIVEKVEVVRNTKKPTTGWPAFDAKVLAVAGRYRILILTFSLGSSLKPGPAHRPGQA